MKLIIATALIFNKCSCLLQKIIPAGGANIIRTKGSPTKPCRLRGIGNKAGPARKE